MDERKKLDPRKPVGPSEPALGYHIPRKYDLVFDVVECHLQPDPSNAIRLAAKDEAIKNAIPFFDLRKQIGFLRTLTIRTATTGEVMVILQVTYDKMEWIEKILNRLANDFPSITSFQYIITVRRMIHLPIWTLHAGKDCPISQSECQNPTVPDGWNSESVQNHSIRLIQNKHSNFTVLPGRWLI